MKLAGRAPAPHAQQRLDARADLRPGRPRLGGILADRREPRARKIAAEGIRQDEIPVGEPLHERARAQPVGALVGEIRLADHEEPGNGAHEVVVDPEPPHRVVRGRRDAHGDAQRIVAGGARVHLEEVPVALAQHPGAQAHCGLAQIEIDAVSAGADAAALVAHGLHRPRGQVARHEVAVARIAAIEEVVALGLRDGVGPAVVTRPDRHPDAAVIAQGLRHERELGLMGAGRGQARGMELHEPGIGERGAAPVRPPDRGGVRRLRVGGQEVGVRVAAGGEHHRVPDVRLDGPRHEVAGDDTARPAVHHDEVQHLAPRQHRDAPGGFLLGERLVGAEQELLTGLPARVEGARHQRAAERAVGELSAVLARERHTLRHGVIDDARRQLGEPVDVRLARPEVAALQRVVEEAVDAVAVVLIVLGGIDPALRGHAVGAAGRIVEAEAAHAIAELRQRGRRGCAGQPGADDDRPGAPGDGSDPRVRARRAAAPTASRSGRTAPCRAGSPAGRAAPPTPSSARPRPGSPQPPREHRDGHGGKADGHRGGEHGHGGTATLGRRLRPQAETPNRRPQTVEEVQAEERRGGDVDAPRPTPAAGRRRRCRTRGRERSVDAGRRT